MATNKKPTHTLRCTQRPSHGRSISRDGGTVLHFGLNDLEALLTVAHEAKEWITAHVLKR